MSSDFDPFINPILKVGCVLFAFFTCLTRVSDYKHHPEVARTKNQKHQKTTQNLTNTKNIKTLYLGCGRGGLTGWRSCLPVAQLPAGKAEWSGDERHVDHLPLGSVHLPPLQ